MDELQSKRSEEGAERLRRAWGAAEGEPPGAAIVRPEEMRQLGSAESPLPAGDGGRRPAYVVGIGASAGGLEALERFFGKMPADTGAAFVVIQHLSPDFKSVMDELLARYTTLPIFRVEDGMRVEPDSLYLIPPKKEMVISGDRLHLTDKDPGQSLSLPIDVFFRSLAQDWGRRAVGIVLSGTGSDGSRGVRAIHEAGGLVLVQREDTAKFDGMPRAAIDTGCTDATLPPEEMPDALRAHFQRTEGEAARGAPPAAVEPTSGLQRVFAELRRRYGIDFSHYKPTTVTRRIQRRLAMNHVSDIDAYARQLADDPQELSALYRDLLIGVTRFFRDSGAFLRLEESVAPQLVENMTSRDGLRVWVAGCATGEEAYSVAMILLEECERRGKPANLKVFATDVHRESLDFASAGTYPAESVSEVSPERLRRFFQRRGEQYQVAAELRQLLVFAPHNVIRDAPFTKLDLITCRNLLIYFEPHAQKKVLSLFHFALRVGGVLMLGPSEGLGPLAEEFETIDEHWKVYRKTREVRLGGQARLAIADTASPALSRPAAPAARHAAPAVDYSLLKAYDLLLDEYVPPSLLITAGRELVHTFGEARDFLHPPRGRASRDVLDMVDGELKIALGAAIQRATKEGGPVTYQGVRIRAHGGEKQVRLVVRPLGLRQAGGGYLLVTMDDMRPTPPPSAELREFDAGEVSRERILALEAELQYTKESLQAVIEEQETSNEELQATNEELVASNEELQSTNEELHSVNEELYTVNAEYQRKIVELTEMTNDMDNLLRATDIGTIFLDRQLRIRKFTPAVGRAFHLLPQDVGRPIEHMSYNLEYARLHDDVRQVLEAETPLEREICSREGAPLLMRILPYRDETGEVDGVVLTFVDIALLKKTEAERAATYRKYESLVHALGEVVYEHHFFQDRVVWSEAFEHVLGYSPEEIGGDGASRLGRIHPDDLPAVQAEFERAVRRDRLFDCRYRFLHKNGHYLWLHDRAQMHLDAEGRPEVMIGIMKNITRQKQAEDEVIEARQFAESIVETIRKPLIVLDADLTLISANRAFYETFGVNRAETVGRRLYELSDGQWNIPQLRRLLEDIIPKDARFQDFVVDHEFPGLGRRTMRLSGRRLERQGNRPHLILLGMEDVTEWKPSDEKLRGILEELSRSNERLEQFAYIASHDLQEPLRVTASFCTLLQKKYRGRLDEDADRYLQHIVGGAERMKALIDGLLAFSRVNRAGKPFEPVSADAALDTALRNLEEAIREAGATIDRAPLPTVVADAGQLAHLFQNLVSNALKFRGENPPLVRIAAREEEGQWVFSVADNGIGIDPKYHERVFDIFQRLHTQDAIPGTGIGLTLCRRIVERRGGRIWVDSAPGAGATFLFTIPKTAKGTP